jgi:Protein of unknown function (DUF2878)
MATLINFVAFQVGWLACVLGAAHRMPLLGTGIALTLVVLHLARAADPVAELKLIVAAAGVGLLLDSLLAAAGFIDFTSGALVAGTVAHWMVALWMVFATTLNASLRWLKDRAALAVVFGAVGGPLAYLAGEKLGALRVEGTVGIGAVALGWAIAMWLLILAARRFDGITAAAGTSPEALQR